MSRQPPILVTGAARSGTTWIGRTLCQSPGLRYLDEPFNRNFRNPEFGVQVDYWLYDAEFGDQRSQIISAYRELLSRNAFQRAIRDSSTPANWKSPLRFLRHFGRHLVQGERLLSKDPLAIVAADWLHQEFGFQVVCTIRSALSFVASMKRAGWGFDANELNHQAGLVERKFPGMEEEIARACKNPGDLIDQNCLLWKAVHSCIIQYQQSHPSWLFVKNEELALNPEAGFQTIFEYLDVPFSDQIRQYVRTFSSSVDQQPPASTKYRPRDAAATIDSWQTELSEHEIARVRNNTAELMDQLYGTDDQLSF